MFETYSLPQASPRATSPCLATAAAPAPEIARRYQLIAVLAGAAGQERPVLGLRRYLPLYVQMWHEPEMRLPRLVRPFVLRAAVGELIETQVTSLLTHTRLSLAVVEGEGILEASGPAEIVHGEAQTYVWHCWRAGIFPIYNRACHDPVERRSLLGVLIVEP